MANFTFSKKLFERREDMDFKDDGTRFRFYFYKGVLPVSTTTGFGNLYCAIRLDYLGKKYADYKVDDAILDEFNGIPTAEACAKKEKFIENCEYIAKKYNLL